MINTVRQLMLNIRLFCGTQCSAASSWRQARTKIFRTTDEADTAHVVSELPRARKPWLYLFSRLRQIATLLAFNASAQHCLFWIICHRRFHYSLSFALFRRRVLARRKYCGTYQCCCKFWLWIFFFCNLFFQNFFYQNFLPKFFLSKLSSNIFFFKTFFQNFFPKIFFSKFVS